MERILRWLAIASICLVYALLPTLSLAATPTAEQLQMLQQLSPADLVRLEQSVKDVGQSVPAKAEPATVSPPVVIPRDPYQDASHQDSTKVRPFGYDLFAGEPTTFVPASDTPVAVDYVIGPGDVIEVQLFGNTNASYSLRVNRRGAITFPSVGSITVAGMSFDDMRKLLQQRVSQQFIGVEASITMGELRSIRVFVLGEVSHPGSYVVNALSTITNALFVSGGVKFIGSLRDVQLKRNGKLVSRLDLYDLLLHGDTRHDQRLQPGDVIFVPPVGPTVTFDGAVRRPAIYEMRDEQSLAAMIKLAGGLQPDAYPDEVRLERINGERERVLMDVNLGDTAGRSTQLQNGDAVHVYSVLEKLENVVTLSGHVERPLAYQWQPGLRLTGIIPDKSLLQHDADMDYVLIRRQDEDGLALQLLSASLSRAMAAPGGEADVLLQPDDEVIVFSLEENQAGDQNDGKKHDTDSRQAILTPLLKRVRDLATLEHPARIVNVGGLVRFPGDYPLDPGMHISDLLRAAGQLRESAYPLEAELTRKHVGKDQARHIEHIDIDLAAILAGSRDNDLQLQPYDVLTIRETPQWREHEYIEIQGEVRFPGRYPIRQGESLADLVTRAGGLTSHAFTDGAVFVREQLKELERKNLNQMADNLERELAGFGLQQAQMRPDQQQAYHFAQQLVTRLRETEAVGRLVINLDDVLAGKGEQGGLKVVDGDKLFVPPQRDEVTVMGEVFFPTSHLYLKGQSSTDYIRSSGGLTANADGKRAYIVRANGSVVPAGQGFWSRSPKVYAGDTIVVPLNADRVNPVRLWTDVTQILYQLSLTAASMRTLGVF